MNRQANLERSVIHRDARHSPRRRLPLPAQIKVGSTQSAPADVHNISASGVFVHCRAALAIGAQVEFVLHCRAPIQPVELRIPATVVRVEPDGVALRFGRYSSVVYTELIEVIYNKGGGVN